MSFSVLFNRYDSLSSNKSKRSWFNQKQRRRRNYSIGQMPRLVMNQVIRSMDTLEQTMLALTSKRMEYCVRMAKVKVSCTYVHVEDELSRISLMDDTVDPIKKVLLCCANKIAEQYVPKITQVDLRKWCSSNSNIENMVNVFKKVEYIFPCEQFALIFYLDGMKKTSVKEILSIPDFQNYTSLRFFRGKIDTDELNSIIDMAKSEQHFVFLSTDIPTDFKNENAFKFNQVEYEDARWAKIEDLYSLRNRDLVTLGRNNLNSFHFNAFIKYWINSDCDMFEQLTINVNEARNDFYDGLVMLQQSGFPISIYLVAAKQDKNRKKPILCFGCSADELMMTAYSLDEQIMKWEEGPLLTCRKEYEILRLLEKKEELKKELMEIENRRIRDEIQKLDDELTKQGVYYEEGIPTINIRNI